MSAQAHRQVCLTTAMVGRRKYIVRPANEKRNS